MTEINQNPRLVFPKNPDLFYDPKLKTNVNGAPKRSTEHDRTNFLNPTGTYRTVDTTIEDFPLQERAPLR